MDAANDVAASGSILIPAQEVAAEVFDVAITRQTISFVFRTGDRATWAKFELELVPASDGHSMTGAMHQFGKVFPVTARRLPLARPQLPKPPFPYRSREVRIDNRNAGVTLAGTLTIPRAKGRHPTALLLTGSGTQDRDETIAGHKPFLVIAEHLTRNGIAVLRVDDRGAGQSTGDPRLATTADYAGDARACLAFLVEQPEIDKARIGLVGHSEGALIATMVAGSPAAGGEPNGIAWIVLLGSPGVSGRKIVLYQVAERVAAPNAEKRDIDATRAAMAKVLDLLPAFQTKDAELRKALEGFCAAHARLTGHQTPIDPLYGRVVGPWYRFFVAYDPKADLKRIRIPVLAMSGELDTQVPPAWNLPPLESALKKGGNEDMTVARLPHLNHMFQTAKTGSMAEYEMIEETFNKGALDRMTRWIRRRTGLVPR